VTFRSQDHYVVGGNPDDSGRMAFSATSPVLGLMWKPSSTTHLYVTAGQSFETPTLNEVAYKTTDGSATGWNTGLKASQGRHLEVGLKQALSIQSGLNVAVFQTDTDDEIGVSRNERGRSSFQNVGRTRRLGAEASLQWRVAPTWSAYTSAAWTQARYRDSFQSTAVAGGTTTTVVPVGNDLPGVPSQTNYAELLWRPTNAWQLAVEARHTGRIWANDINTEAAASYTLLALRAGWTQAYGDWRLSTLLRIDNVTNQHAVGSVIVNEGNKRYYEPSPGRSALFSVQVTRAF